ncbi:MAG: hypothetical protein WBI44_08470 [Syntrophaceticus sp.]
MIIISITTGRDDQGREFIEVDSKIFGENLRFTVEKVDDEQSALRVSFRQNDGTFVPGTRIPLERVPDVMEAVERFLNNCTITEGLPNHDQKDNRSDA